MAPILLPPPPPAACRLPLPAILQVCSVRATAAPEAAPETGTYAAEFTKEIVEEEKK